MYVKLICLAPQLTTLWSSRSKAGLKPWLIRFWYFITITTKRNCHTFHVPQSIDTNFPLSGISSTQLSIYPMNKITTTCVKDQWMHDKVQELIPRLKTNVSIFAFLFFFNPIELNWIELNNWWYRWKMYVVSLLRETVSTFEVQRGPRIVMQFCYLWAEGMLSLRGQYSLSNNA